MEFLAVLLGVFLAVVVVLTLLVLGVWFKIKRKARSLGINNLGTINSNLQSMKIDMEQIREQESHRAKNVSGMTNLLKPNIIKDFPDFNENLLYNMTEDNLRVIFSAITNRDSSGLDKIPLIRPSLELKIEDYRINNIKEEYKDVVFHDFAIKDYTKIDGVATITISTSVEYYYSKIVNGKVKNESRYKKQTRYSCKFIYIYDESKIKDNQNVIATNCPNCGAVISMLGQKQCSYCGSAVHEINLKTWAFSSYEEY
jgi:hypothetical protein